MLGCRAGKLIGALLPGSLVLGNNVCPVRIPILVPYRYNTDTGYVSRLLLCSILCVLC
jgi:hypothetical protein